MEYLFLVYGRACGMESQGTPTADVAASGRTRKFNRSWVIAFLIEHCVFAEAAHENETKTRCA